MSTKQKILDAALKLFNELGTDAVTVRTIAKEIGISHGNLCYHFASTEAIILKLYESLVDEMSAAINNLPVAEVGFSQLYQSARASFYLQYKYRFLMLDFVRIMRNQPEIKKHFQGLMHMRSQQFSGILQQLFLQGLLKPEIFPGHYNLLIEQILLTGDFWMSHGEIMFNGTEEEKINHYLQVMNASLLGCLTERGVVAFMQAA